MLKLFIKSATHLLGTFVFLFLFAQVALACHYVTWSAPSGAGPGGWYRSGTATLNMVDANGGWCCTYSSANGVTYDSNWVPVSNQGYNSVWGEMYAEAHYGECWDEGTRSASASWYIDDVAPGTPSVTGAANGGSYATPLSITFSATDATSGVWNYQYILDGVTTSLANGVNGISIASTGSHTLQVRARDRAGNYGSYSTAITFTVNPALSATCNGSPTTSPLNQSVTWTAVPAGGTGSFTYSWSGTDSLTGSSITATKSYSTTGSKSASVVVTSGATQVTADCSITVDAGPSISITSPANSDLVGGTVNVETTSTDNTGVTRVEILNGAVVLAGNNISPAATPTNQTLAWDTTVLTDGVHTVTAKAYDAVGNTTTANVTVSVFNGLSGCRNIGSPRLTGLISTPQLTGKFSGTSGTCVTGSTASPLNAAAVPIFQIPSYAELKSLYFTQSKFNNKVDLNGATIPSSFTEDTIYYTSSSVDMGNVSGNGTIVAFIDGDLIINDDISYHTNDNNGGLVLIVGGNIYIDSNVTQVDAVLIAQGVICTNATGASCLAEDPTLTEGILTVNGSLISLSTNPANKIQFNRNLALIPNGNQQAAEVINAKAKYLVILNKLLSRPLSITTEDTSFGVNQ